MTDIFTKKKRSEIMSRIRGKNTSVEKAVFRLLRRKKIHFQRHYKKIPGSPDIALPSSKKAVFIDGDFWHGWRFEKIKQRLPNKYWKDKIANNIKRDRKNRLALKSEGWSVMRVWEHEIEKNEEAVAEKIMDFLHN